MTTLEQQVRDLAVEFLDLAGEMIHGLDHHRLAHKTVLNRFIAQFGITPRHCACVWIFSEQKIRQIDSNRQKKHLLWTLNLLKTGASEAEMHGRWGADEKTIRKWLYIVLEALGDLGVVSIIFIVGILCCTGIL